MDGWCTTIKIQNDEIKPYFFPEHASARETLSSTHETSHEHEIEPPIVVCAAVCRTQLRARTGALSHACAHGNHGTWIHTQKKTFSAGRQPSRFDNSIYLG